MDCVLNKKEELENCSFVKTILMLLVAAYHSILFWGGEWFTRNPAKTSEALSLVAGWLNSFHIYAFTLVSGYIFYYIKYEKGKYNSLGRFINNKLKRLIVPYLFAALVWVIPINCVFYRYNIFEIVYNYVLATNPSQLWFLVMLFNVFVIFYLLSDFFVEHTYGGLIVVLGMYMFGLVGGKAIPNVFMIWTACRYVLMFWIGVKMRQYIYEKFQG